MNTRKMICPSCGAEMNFHALKLHAAAVGAVDEESKDEFARALREVHSCPGCGRTESRAANED